MLYAFEMPFVLAVLLPETMCERHKQGIFKQLARDDISLTSRMTLLYWGSNRFTLYIPDYAKYLEVALADASEVELSAGWQFYLARCLRRAGFFYYWRSDPARSALYFLEADKLLTTAIENEPDEAVLRLEIATLTYYMQSFARKYPDVASKATDCEWPKKSDVFARMQEFVDAPHYTYLAAPPYVEWLENPLDAKWLTVQALIGWMGSDGVENRMSTVSEWATENEDWQKLDLLAAFCLKCAERTGPYEYSFSKGTHTLSNVLSKFIVAAEDQGESARSALLREYKDRLSQLSATVSANEKQALDSKISKVNTLSVVAPVSSVFILFLENLKSDIASDLLLQARIAEEYLPELRTMVHSLRREWKELDS